MDRSTFLKRIFNGFVHSYGAFRWPKLCDKADMTQKELAFFSNLGTSLGFIPKREHTEITPKGHTYRGKSYPRDLVWLDPENNNNVFLHLERENDSKKAAANFTGNNKLRDGARFKDARYLVGLFGFLKEEHLGKIRLALTTSPDFGDKDILIIGFCGEDENSAKDVIGLVYSKLAKFERHATADLDQGEYWYLYFDKEKPSNLNWREI